MIRMFKKLSVEDGLPSLFQQGQEQGDRVACSGDQLHIQQTRADASGAGFMER